MKQNVGNQHYSVRQNSSSTQNHCFWLENFPRCNLHESHLLANHSFISFLPCLDERNSETQGLVCYSENRATVWDPFMGCSPCKATSCGWFSFFISKLTSFFSCRHIFVNLALQFPVSANIWLHEVNLLFSLLFIFLSTSLILSDKKCWVFFP